MATTKRKKPKLVSSSPRAPKLKRQKLQKKPKNVSTSKRPAKKSTVSPLRSSSRPAPAPKRSEKPSSKGKRQRAKHGAPRARHVSAPSPSRPASRSAPKRLPPKKPKLKKPKPRTKLSPREREERRLLREQKKRIEERKKKRLLQKLLRDIERLTANQKRRDRQHKKKHGGKQIQESTNAPVPGPAPVQPRPPEPHPAVHPEDAVIAELVLEWLRAELRRMAREEGGRSRTYLYPESGEVVGMIAFEQDYQDAGIAIAALGDAALPMRSSLYYRETFYQARAWFVTGKADKGLPVSKRKGKKKTERDSPKDDSKIGPDGTHYGQARTHWFRGDIHKALVTLRYMVENVVNATGNPLSSIEIRAYWSPLGRRPER